MQQVDDPATALRAAMVADLRASGVLVDRAVEAAMLVVPRHRFIPEVVLHAAYADEAVTVKRGTDGRALSSASQPAIVATMLQELGVRPGQRVLEVGTGTGYNAALLAHLAGEAGRVLSVELEPDLAERATRALAQTGVDSVTVVIGDGRRGHPDGLSFDRIIVTTGAGAVVDAWADQLAEGGRLVVPVVDDSGVGSVLTFEKRGGRMVRCGERRCGFLPLRHAAADSAQ
ncbi:MAG: methyltransferase domain-containing protein [Acidimicrobiales bacterium]